jgi:putative transposase
MLFKHSINYSAIFPLCPDVPLILVLKVMAAIITEYPQFFTATNLQWKKLLKPDKYKDIVISSLRFLVNDKRAKIFALVILENHIHLVWQMMPDNDPEELQRDFLNIQLNV